MKLTDKQREKLAVYLRKRRKYHNLNQGDLADKLKVSGTYISRIENCHLEHSPSLDFIRNCVGVFGDNMITVSSMLGLIDSRQLQARAAANYDTAVLLNRIAAGDKLLDVEWHYKEGD